MNTKGLQILPVPPRPCMMQLKDFSDLQLIPEDVARYSDNGQQLVRKSYYEPAQ